MEIFWYRSVMFMDETVLSGESRDIVSDNVSKLKEIFPEVITEDKIDFEKLKLILGEDIETDSERYAFTWPGKTQAIKESQKQSTGTLRPCKEESKNWDTTENLYIEGDNLEVLKLLQKSYYGKIKAIYIDPPYNTGKDFIYKDNYSDNLENYLKISGQVVSEDLDSLSLSLSNDIKVSTNTETQGRYHSNWLNMMYPRLKLARNLLSDDGAIFISIDDNEVENLKKICNEIFGEENFIGEWNWYKSETPPNLSKKIKKNIEYILVYEKIINNSKYEGIQKFSKSDNGLLNQSNSFKTLIFPANVIKTKMKNQIFKKGIYGTDNYKVVLEENTEIKDGLFIKDVILSSKFKWSQEKLMNEIKNGTVISIKTNTLSPSYEKASYDPEVPKNFIDKSVNVDTIENAGRELKKLFNNKKVFDYPKPISLIKYLFNFLSSSGSEVYLDFFSGSATTADAVMSLNIEKKSNNNFILVQIPEATDEKSEAYKAGFKNICEIGKERIRIAGDKLVEESGNNDLDIGFKVFKLDSSNLEKWDPDYNNLEQTLLTSQDNIKQDRTQEDLIYEIMLKYGIDLTLPIQKHETETNIIYSVGFGTLLICLDNNITKEIASEILKLTEDAEISRVVFKDNGFASDSDKTNIKEILKTNNIDEFITI